MLLVAIAISAFWSGTSKATDVTIRGAGLNSCTSWTQEHRDRTSQANTQDNWVFAFVTAEEFFSSIKRSKNSDNADLIAWMTDYCANKPQAQVMDASYLLTIELRSGDPANLKSFKEMMRSVYRRKCEAGDTEACNFLGQMR